MSRHPSIHPGEIRYNEFLVPLDITSDRLAEAIHVDSRRIEAIVHAKRSITAETALLFSRFFGKLCRVLDGATKSVRSRDH